MQLELSLLPEKKKQTILTSFLHNKYRNEDIHFSSKLTYK